MDCLFCHNKASIDSYNMCYVYHDCSKCHAAFCHNRVYNEITDIVYAYFGCYYKENQYWIKLNFDRNDFQLECGAELIVSLKYIPDLTPQNIEQRLPFLLTFS